MVDEGRGGQGAAVVSAGGLAVAKLLVGRVAGRVPVIAAGSVRTPDQAQRAIDVGLSLVAVGQGLVMNPEWVERTKTRPEMIDLELNPSRIASTALPPKLWNFIEATRGWFAIVEDGHTEAS